MSKFKVGIIGCGRISAVYVEAFKKAEQYIEVCFAMDKVQQKAKIFADNFENCQYTDNYQTMLDAKLDVIHVCTPHYLHKKHVISALKAGCHVLTEKPIATTMQDAYDMINAAKIYNKQLGVIFQNRYIEGIQEVKRLIQTDVFGKITGAFSHLAWHRPTSYYECDWKGSWEKEGGGVVIDQAIHSIDLVRYLMGCEASEINAHISRRILTNIEVEDEADAVITFENGARYAFFACNYYVKNRPIIVEITGEKATAVLSETEVTIKIDGKDAYTVLPKQGENVAGVAYWGAYHNAQVMDFYEKLSQGNSVNIQPTDATKTLEIVLGIYQSAKENRTINF